MTRRKLLIQMSGAPGSGKSTLAHLLAPLLSAIIINHDLIKSTLLSSSIPFTQSAQLTYNLQFRLAEDILKQGHSVIIDSTCNYQETLDAGKELAKEYGVEWRYVECSLSDIEILEERLRGRVGLRSQRSEVSEGPVDGEGMKSGDEERRRFRGWMERPCRPESGGIVTDSTRSPEECLDDVLKQLGLDFPRSVSTNTSMEAVGNLD